MAVSAAVTAMVSVSWDVAVFYGSGGSVGSGDSDGVGGLGCGGVLWHVGALMMANIASREKRGRFMDGGRRRKEP